MTNCDVSKRRGRLKSSDMSNSNYCELHNFFILKRRFLQSITERLDPRLKRKLRRLRPLISPSGGLVPRWVWTTSTIFVATFQIIFFCLDRVQVAGAVEQSKFIVRVQLHNFFSSSRDLENILYFLPEQHSGSTTIPEVVYFDERHPP